MLTSALRSVSLVIRKQIYPGYFSACLKSTVADPVTTELDDAKPFKDMPGPRGRYAIPKFGPLFFMKPFGQFTGQTFHKLLDSLHNKYGLTFRMELFGPTVFTADPNGIETLFRNEGRMPKRISLKVMQTYAEINNMTLGTGVVNGPQWYRPRSATQKYMLKVDSALVYIAEQVAVSNDLITRMSTMSYTPEEFRNELFKYATESIGVVCFNKRLGCLEPDNKPMTPETARYLDAVNQFFQLMGEDIGPPLYRIFPTKYYKNFERAANEAYGFGRVNISKVLAKAEREIEEGTFDPEEPNLILKLHANPNTTVEAMNAILLDLLAAGTDSTAKNMGMFLLSLALNRDKQKKLYEEILTVIGPKGNEIEAHHMSKMPYFRACMKESFRLNFPTVFGTVRALPHDVIFDGYLVPKGTYVATNSRHICLDSQYFENPRTFAPERWLRDENTTRGDKKVSAFSLLPFGFGKRNCLGRRFAEQELWLGVTKIVQNFEVTVSEEDKNYEMIYSTFGQTKEPVSFTFTPRKL